MACFATVTLSLMLSYLLIDIASTFQVSLGKASQTSLFSSITVVITALILTFLSLRFKQKSLIIIGLICMLSSGIGCFFAPTLNLLYLSYSLQGVASVMVFPMALALVGNTYPTQKRAKAVSYLVAAASFSNLVVVCLTGLIATNFGWRFIPLLFAVPASSVALVLVFLFVPSYSENSLAVTSTDYLKKIKSILSNRSATACFIGNSLRTSAHMAISLFGVSFYRQRFLITMGQSTVLMLGGTLLFIVGTLISGNISSRFGKKPLTIFSSALAGLFIICLYYMPNFWFALPFDYLALFFFGLASSAALSHTLDQVPTSRSTLMSLNTVFGALGTAIAPTLGGTILDAFSFEAMGLTLGALGAIAAIVFVFTKEQNSK
ncbi:MAG: MFS transporter [Candidatus Bathyarchaeota archaeon]|nr:MFS transporter [Candidatus Bathyarchaeum sp.]